MKIIRLASMLSALLVLVVFLCACSNTDSSVNNSSSTEFEATYSSGFAGSTTVVVSEVTNSDPTNADSISVQPTEDVSASERFTEHDTDISVTITESVTEAETYVREPEIDFSDLM